MDTIEREYIVEDYEDGTRLDVYVTKKQEILRRSYIQKLIKEGKVTLNGKTSKSSKKLQPGDYIKITFEPPQPVIAQPEDIPVEIVYEDSDIIVVNKQKGLVVHPAPGTPTGTLVNALLYHTKDLSGINGELRPGIVHRIDKDTTGILVIAKNDQAHQGLAEQFEKHSINREYVALVKGEVREDQGTIDMPIGRDPNNRIKRKVTLLNSKDAITHFKVLKHYLGYTLCSFKLETGRTHQIRVHMSELGYPVLGDPLYGKEDKKFPVNGQMLHAKKLGFIHPGTGEYVEFEAEPPQAFKEIVDTLEEELRDFEIEND